jgi:hypothetical protein
MHVVAVAPKLYKACREKLEMIEHKEKELEQARQALQNYVILRNDYLNAKVSIESFRNHYLSEKS